MLLVIIIKPIVGYIGDRTGQYAFVIKIALIASIIISIFYYQSRTFAMVITASLLFGYVYEHMNGFIVFRIATVILIGTLILVICSESLDEVGSSITNKLLLKENLEG